MKSPWHPALSSAPSAWVLPLMEQDGNMSLHVPGGGKWTQKPPPLDPPGLLVQVPTQEEPPVIPTLASAL